MRINKFKIYTYIFITAILGWSCSTKNSCYTDFHNIPIYGWKTNEPVTFHINDSILDDMEKTNIKITLRHDNSYPYHDLFLTADLTKYNGETTTTEISCHLANENNEWLGSGFGAIYEFNTNLKENFNLKDYSQIRIWQSMNDSIINGISELGITIIDNK